MGIYRSLAAKPAGPEVFGADFARRIMAEWGGTPSRQALAKKSRWRDSRLAALAAHKRSQPEK